MNVLIIALNTFREAVRDRLVHMLLVFAFLLIVVSRAVGWVSYGGEEKIMTDLGLTAVWFFTAMVSILIGTGMIYKEIDKRTLYTILCKPIDRWEFMFGKYFGLLLTTFVCWFVLSVVLLGYLRAVQAPLTYAIVQALVLTFCEMMVVTAMAVFFSSASTPLLSAIFTCLLFGIGQLTKWVVDLGYVARETVPWLESLLRAAYLVLPNLHNFNVRQAAVQAAGRGVATAISGAEMQAVVLYGVAYAGVLLLASVLIFRRRSF
jgi:ABC-type transport system involved in multi-copper enzyme maturation permease subunit